jgi:hypothetical protein
MLDIADDDDSETLNLNFWIEQASDWILEYLDRKDIDKKSRTLFLDGSGTAELLLPARPVFQTPAIQCWVDQRGFYGQTSGSFASNTELIQGTNFVLKLDTSDGTSRCGILIRIDGGTWPKPPTRQPGYLASFWGPGYGCIKTTFTAGYTVDTLPAQLRSACNILVARMRYLLPLGVELASESYEERHISLYSNPRSRDWLMGPIKPMLFTLRNWTF